MSDSYDDFEEIYDEDEDYTCCALCGCIIGDEVGFGVEIAPGVICCDNCMEE